MRGVPARGAEPLIEQWQLDAAQRAQACTSRLRRYKAGQPISNITFADAVWVEDKCPDIGARLPLPLWTYSSRGGYGDGDGYETVIGEVT